MTTKKRRLWALARAFMDLEGHVVTFKVRTPGSNTGKALQTPVFVVHGIRTTRDGNYVVRGVDLKKVTDPRDVQDAIRHYRLDRITTNLCDMGAMADSPYITPKADAEGYVGF